MECYRQSCMTDGSENLRTIFHQQNDEPILSLNKFSFFFLFHLLFFFFHAITKPHLFQTFDLPFEWMVAFRNFFWHLLRLSWSFFFFCFLTGSNTHLSLSLSLCLYLSLFFFLAHLCVYVYTHVCMYIRVCVCVSKYMLVCMRVYESACVCMCVSLRFRDFKYSPVRWPKW